MWRCPFLFSTLSWYYEELRAGFMLLSKWTLVLPIGTAVLFSGFVVVLSLSVDILESSNCSWTACSLNGLVVCDWVVFRVRTGVNMFPNWSNCFFSYVAVFISTACSPFVTVIDFELVLLLVVVVLQACFRRTFPYIGHHPILRRCIQACSAR